MSFELIRLVDPIPAGGRRKRPKPAMMLANAVLRGTSTGSMHARRNEAKAWRAWAHDEALALGWPVFDVPVIVTAVHLISPNRHGGALPDVGACFPQAKAMVDGLVQAGILHADRPEYVRSLKFTEPVEYVDPDTGRGRFGVRLVLRELNVADPVRSSVDVRTPAGGITLSGDPRSEGMPTT